MENSIIIKKKKRYFPRVLYFKNFYLEAHDLSNQQMHDLFK
jgi:hypothetical protein